MIATKYRGERDRRIGNALWLFGATDGQIDTPLNGAAHPPAPISRALSPQYASIWHAWSGPSRGWPPTPRRWRFSVRIRTAHRSISQQDVHAHVQERLRARLAWVAGVRPTHRLRRVIVGLQEGVGREARLADLAAYRAAVACGMVEMFGFWLWLWIVV